MLTPQFLLDIHRELAVDLFAGGGGASTGIEQALGRPVDIAINHDPEAVSLHEANHPQTHHFVSDVFEVDPLAVTGNRPVGLLWASPDCKHFSKAKGGKPVSKKIRGLAWVVVKWAKLVKPRVICLENVEEFQTWGPLGKDDRPCPNRKGRTFRRWKRTGLASSGLVGALLKYDLHAGRIYKMRGRYCWNPNHVPAARPPRPGSMCETLEWREISNDDFPDADLTVLVRLRGNEEPVWLGYWDDEEWRDIDGQVVDVVRWADIPKGGEV